MNKINFEDLPSANTPLSAQNLNALQDNIDNAKVEKETGKGLSTNDYTNADKDKVDNMPEVVNSLDGNETAKAPSVKAVNDAIEPVGWTKINDEIRYIKCGNLVTIRGSSEGTKALTLNDYTVVGSMPSDSRPSMYLYSNWGRIGMGTTGTLRLESDTGNIALYTQEATNYWCFTLTYIVGGTSVQ